MKKNFAGIVTLVMLFTFIFAGASLAEEKTLNVVTTIFPVYDWVREVAGDSGNVEITMLLDNGVDLHSYQPTAQDIMKVATCDVFAYVGGESDEWVKDALAEAVNPDMVAVNLVEAVGEDIKLEEIVEGME
ncbi:MAG: zinc ABC transporter substrate-binding protein, partial [Clostridia bacterium]|nr:zinc ABC transporter substrate-binding protein [Clostridia bacterium]